MHAGGSHHKSPAHSASLPLKGPGLARSTSLVSPLHECMSCLRMMQFQWAQPTCQAAAAFPAAQVQTEGTPQGLLDHLHAGQAADTRPVHVQNLVMRLPAAMACLLQVCSTSIAATGKQDLSLWPQALARHLQYTVLTCDCASRGQR